MKLTKPSHLTTPATQTEAHPRPGGRTRPFKVRNTQIATAGDRNTDRHALTYLVSDEVTLLKAIGGSLDMSVSMDTQLTSGQFCSCCWILMERQKFSSQNKDRREASVKMFHSCKVKLLKAELRTCSTDTQWWMIQFYPVISGFHVCSVHHQVGKLPTDLLFV